jgi:hypothetical protein
MYGKPKECQKIAELVLSLQYIKKGDKTDCNNDRPLTHSNIAYEIYCLRSCTEGCYHMWIVKLLYTNVASGNEK